MDYLRKKNAERLERLNLPEHKPKVSIMVFDPDMPYSLDVVEIKNPFGEKDFGMHGCWAAQVIKLVNDNVELHGAAWHGTEHMEKVIDYCIEHGIKIISASMTFGYTAERESILKKYADWGGIFIAAAGNYDDRSVMFPASSKYTIGVSTTNSEDCNGPQIDVTTDSYWFVRNKKTGRYTSFNGTSCATPVIAGCVSYIIDKYPHWKLTDIQKYLKDNSTNDIGSLEKYERFFSFPDGFGGDDMKVEMTIGEKDILVNGHKVEIDVAPFIQDDRTFLPARALAEALGCKVEWDKANRKITITK